MQKQFPGYGARALRTSAAQFSGCGLVRHPAHTHQDHPHNLLCPSPCSATLTALPSLGSFSLPDMNSSEPSMRRSNPNATAHLPRRSDLPSAAQGIRTAHATLARLVPPRQLRRAHRRQPLAHWNCNSHAHWCHSNRSAATALQSWVDGGNRGHPQPHHQPQHENCRSQQCRQHYRDSALRHPAVRTTAAGPPFPAGLPATGASTSNISRPPTPPREPFL